MTRELNMALRQMNLLKQVEELADGVLFKCSDLEDVHGATLRSNLKCGYVVDHVEDVWVDVDERTKKKMTVNVYRRTSAYDRYLELALIALNSRIQRKIDHQNNKIEKYKTEIKYFERKINKANSRIRDLDGVFKTGVYL